MYVEISPLENIVFFQIYFKYISSILYQKYIIIFSKGVKIKYIYGIYLNIGAHDDGVFNECMTSDQETDNDIASINLKDNGDDADDDDDDDDVDPDYDDDADYDDG